MVDAKKTADKSEFVPDVQNLGIGVTGYVNEDEGMLYLAIDLNGQFKISGSGENITVATTGGNQPIAFGNMICRVGCNVFRPPSVAEQTEHLEEIQNAQQLHAVKLAAKAAAG